jgi:hypothetical protein
MLHVAILTLSEAKGKNPRIGFPSLRPERNPYFE